jgi:hypothetical protein
MGLAVLEVVLMVMMAGVAVVVVVVAVSSFKAEGSCCLADLRQGKASARSMAWERVRTCKDLALTER